MAPPSAIDDAADSYEPFVANYTSSVPGRLTVQGIAKRRAAEGRLVAGVAALADVEGFKGRTAHLHKHKARRWDRKPSQIHRDDWP